MKPWGKKKVTPWATNTGQFLPSPKPYLPRKEPFPGGTILLRRKSSEEGQNKE